MKKSSNSSGKTGRTQITGSPQSGKSSALPGKQTASAPPARPSGPTKSEIVKTLDKLRYAKSVTEVNSSKKHLIDLIKKVKPNR